MRHRTKFLSGLLVLTFLVHSGGAKACTCAAYPAGIEQAVEVSYARADVVFFGEAIAVKKKRFRTPSYRDGTFRVRKRWKGSFEDTLLVRSNVGEIACGYDFRLGRSYLIFAHWEPRSEVFTTSFCDLNRTEADAATVSDVLDRMIEREEAAEVPASGSETKPGE